MNGEPKSADFTISLSSDVIAEVMEKHFNKEMFKRKVTIVDLKPLEDGYMFLLAYEQEQKQQQKYDAVMPISIGGNSYIEHEIQRLSEDTPRAKNGRFAKKDA